MFKDRLRLQPYMQPTDYGGTHHFARTTPAQPEAWTKHINIYSGFMRPVRTLTAFKLQMKAYSPSDIAMLDVKSLQATSLPKLDYLLSKKGARVGFDNQRNA
jgi:hypothetical protein